MKILHFVVLLFAFFIISGCSTSNPLDSKNALRYQSTTKFENIIFKDNYNDLAKCWAINAKKQKVNFNNATFMEIYPKNDQAEIYVGWTATSFTNKMYYGILFDLNKISEHETLVNAYGVGHMGETLIPSWLGVLKDCETEKLRQL